MKKIVIGLIILAVVIVTIGLLSTSQEPPSGEAPSSALDKAPDFSLQDIFGQTVSLSDFSGKVVIANSWATWCPFCKAELVDFSILQKEFPNELVIIAIDRNESLEKSKEFTDSMGITNDLIFLLDPGDSFYRDIGGFAMPETLFINGDREIVLHKRGAIDLAGMRQVVESILNS